MEAIHLSIGANKFVLVRDGQRCWVAPLLCHPALTWTEGYKVRDGMKPADTPAGFYTTVPTGELLPALLPSEAAQLRAKQPRKVCLLSLPAALRNLRKMPGKAQWRAVADDVFTSLENLEAYIHDLGGGAPGPAGAGAPAPNIHARSMHYPFRAMGARGRLWVVQPAGSQIQKCGTAGGCSGHFGRRNLPQSFPSLDCISPHMSPTPSRARWPTKRRLTSCLQWWQCLRGTRSLTLGPVRWRPLQPSVLVGNTTATIWRARTTLLVGPAASFTGSANSRFSQLPQTMCLGCLRHGPALPLGYPVKVSSRPAGCSCIKATPRELAL